MHRSDATKNQSNIHGVRLVFWVFIRFLDGHRTKNKPAALASLVSDAVCTTVLDDAHLISVYDPKRAEKEHIDSNIKYHIEFFRNGLNAIVKLWLANGCRETPEEMAEVLKQEYRGR